MKKFIACSKYCPNKQLQQDLDIALHDAVESEDTVAVMTLLTAGANVNIINQYGEAPLHIAVKRGFIDIVKHLLVHHAHVNTAVTKGLFEGDTPLHFAASHGDICLVKILLAAKTKVNTILVKGPFEGETPLDGATRGNYTEIVTLLNAYIQHTHHVFDQENKDTPPL